MIISVPINHTVVGTLKGKRTETSQSHTNFVDIQIRSVLGDDAPVIMTWDDTPPNGISAYERDQWTKKQKAPDNGLQTLREVDDKFYMQHHSGITTENIDHHSSQDFIDKLLDLKQWSNHKPPFDKAGYRVELPITSDFDAIVEKARNHSQTLIFIDGNLHVQVDEPVLTHEALNIDGRMSAAMRIIPKEKVRGETLLMSVLDYNDIVDMLNASSVSRFNKTGWQITKDKAPVIHRPDLLSFNFTEENLLRACDLVFNKAEPFSTASVPLARIEPELGIAYLQTKLAYENWLKTGEQQHLLDVCLDTNSRFPEMFGNRSFFSLACRHYEENQTVSIDGRLQGPRP